MSRSKHIVFVQSGLGAGGAEKIINLLAQHRTAKGDKVYVLAFHNDAKSSYFPYPDNITIRTMTETKGGIGGTLGRILWLRETLREIAPDLVISFLTKINIVTLLASIGLGLRVIVSERNNPQRQSAHPLWTILGRLTERHSFGIVMQTEAAKKTLAQRLQAKVAVIANPCTLSRAPDVLLRSQDTVVAAGRLTKQKGFDLLIRAFGQLAKQNSNAKLVIWGDGEERSTLEELIIEMDMADRISMPGRTSQPLDWIESGEVFALSSRYEGFPNVLAEAMAAGMAPVAFDCPWGPSEMIENNQNGLLVPEGDINGFAAALSKMLTQTELRHRVQHATQNIQERFSLECILMAWDVVLDKAVQDRHA